MPSAAEERDSQICQRYLTKDISCPQLAIEYRLSEIRIRQILKAGNVGIKDRPPSLAEGDKTLSARHVKIGKKFLNYRSLTLGVDRPYLSEKMNWSVQKIAAVEKGIFNLTLLDLEDLAKIFRTSLPALLEATTTVEPVDQENSTDQNLTDERMNGHNPL